MAVRFGDRGGQRLGRSRLGRGLRHRLVAAIFGVGDGLGGDFGRRVGHRLFRGFSLPLGVNVFPAHVLDVVLDIAVATISAAAARLVILVGFRVQALLFGDQPFAVGDRDLIVVGMDLRKGQEAVAVAAILDEGCLQRRFYSNHLRQIDVAFERLSTRGLEIEFFESRSVNNDHPCLFGVARINEHAPCHGSLRSVRILTGASNRRPNRLSGARGAVRHQPAERPTWPRRGSVAPPGHNWALPTSGFL